MANLNLIANTGFYDRASNSWANLNHIQSLIHGTKASPGLQSLGTVLCACLDQLSSGNYNIHLELNNVGTHNFDVNLDISPNIQDNQVISFYVFLKPSFGIETPLPPIQIKKNDRKLKFRVINHSITGIYNIFIHAVLSTSSNFELHQINTTVVV